jgi:Tfp pilus assembly protein PilN
VRPINLIPAEQRRGAARGPGARPSIAGYVVLGALGAAVLCVLAVVMTSNQINSKTDDLADIHADSQQEKQVADALRPYGQFADLQRSRMTQINTLAKSRYNWERPLRQLSKAIPRNVWLLVVTATENPTVQIEEGGSGGDISTLREKTQAPTFAISGCTYSQHAVARMMSRMRNLDDVTKVHLAKSARKEETESSSGTAITAGQDNQASQEISDCTGSARVTKFDMLVEFGGADPATAAPGAATVASAAATPIDKANAAVATGNQASAAAGGTTP